MSSARPEPIAPVPLRATVGEPALLELSRGPIRPPVRAGKPGLPPGEHEPTRPAPEPPPLTLPALEAALASSTAEAEAEAEGEGEGTGAEEGGPEERRPEPGPAGTEADLERASFGVALLEDEVIFDRARTALEDLALLGTMRRPLPDQGWAGRAEAERRLLARVDAIAACGEEVLPRLVALLEERPLPDPELTWSLVFLFGSIAGSDAAEEAMRLARAATLQADGMVAALADALALAPNPALATLLGRWLSDPAPEQREVAVRALSRRGALTTAQAFAAAGDPHVPVVAAAAAALATSAGPLDPALLWKLAHHGDERVVAAALEAALVRKSDAAPRRARQLVSEGRGDHAGAALVLAVSGGAEDLDLLRGAAAAGSAAVPEALGWFGHAAAVDDLLASLAGESAPAALDALQRVTAATLTDADPAPEYEKGKEPFTASEGPVPEPIPLCADPEAWRAWWKEHGKRVRPGTRLRFGRPWTPGDDLRELEHPLSVPRRRRLAYLELCARMPGAAPLDIEAFIARQRRELAALGDLAARTRAAPGTWPVHLKR